MSSIRPSRKTPPPEITAITPPLTPPSESSQLPANPVPASGSVPENYVAYTLRTSKPLPPVTWQNFWTELNWLNVVILSITPALTIYGLYTTKVVWKTALFSVFYYFATGLGMFVLTLSSCLPAYPSLGITAGYHRLWAHRSYNASRPLEYFLAITGAGAVQGSIKWWARGHRAHHRYTDTDLDPYGAHHGLLWSHIGWMVVKPRRKPGVADISDLSKNHVVRWQHRWYLTLLILMAFAVPTLVAGLGWGDWRGGMYYAGATRLMFVHHVSFSFPSSHAFT
jgi:stearoyl-CoA desaturase (Delta-9 desaturase)